MAASVRLSELTKLYGATRAVDRLSLSIAPGNMVALLGPSGCGKTTTLRMIAGLVEPNAGDIFIDERRITRVPVHRRNIGMLFQNYALFPHMTVAENIAFGLETRGVKGAAAAARIKGACNWCNCPVTATDCRRSSPAGSSSESRWPGRSSWSRCCCCSTNRWGAR
jgi:putative spermidine/putrescine transport system ATP-binding protein/spermidine/putrescine transport system ATP-binding protein